MSKKEKNSPDAVAQAKQEAHMKELQNTKYEISALTLAQISELLNHLGSIPYYDIAGMIGSEIRSQLPEEAQKEIAELEAKQAKENEIVLEPTVEDIDIKEHK